MHPHTPLKEVHIVVLAAGKGTRMKSSVAKILHEAAGVSLLEHVLRVVDPISPASIVVIIGHQTESVREALGGGQVSFAVQDPQLVTAHARLQAEAALEGQSGTVLLLSGDVPLLRTQTVDRLIRHHLECGAAATVLTAEVDRPEGYGRIVRSPQGIQAIV